MTLKELYNTGTDILKNASIQESSLDAWYLLEYVTGITRARYFVDSQQTVPKNHQKQYLQLIQKRAEHIPLQHLTGVQEFMGLEFHVNEHVLIPRQDTEILVETALEKLKEISNPVNLLDMCTGSGCILLSILYYMKNKKQITGTGVDISDKALEVARKNAKSLGLSVDFLQSDLFDKITDKYSMIVSNPPYIRSDVIKTLQEEVREHDPMLALDGMEDGLYFYRKIISESEKYLQADGYLIFEIGHDQGLDVSNMMKDAGFRDVLIKKDLAGLDRVVLGVYDTKR
ncbi:peptide chain release factor N(5)-glutamine methyltransferase [Firmicutes bacterium i23-0019-B6]